MISNLAALPGSFNRLIDLILLGLSFFLKPLSGTKKKFLAFQVHAQHYQKQQGNLTAILIRSCKLGAFNPQRNTFLIDRQQHLFVARFSLATVDQHSLTTIDRRHSSSVDRNLPSDVDRYFSPNIDRYLTTRHGCDLDTCT